MAGPAHAVGISLWLVPRGAVGGLLSRWIERLAERLGTEPFPPHVTLLPGISAPAPPVLDATAALAATLEPFPVHLGGVDGRDEHFRCLFVRAELSEPLRDGHARAAERFGCAPDPSFAPHLSLVYGSVDPAVKAELARELDAPTRGTFDAAHLHAWRTEGPVEAWRELGVFPLARLTRGSGPR